MTNVADFRRKNTDVRGTQGECNVMQIFFGSPLGKVAISASSFIIVGYPPSVLI